LNDLPYGLHQAAKPVICADDNSVLLTAKNDEELKTKINCTLDYITESPERSLANYIQNNNNNNGNKQYKIFRTIT